MKKMYLALSVLLTSIVSLAQNGMEITFKLTSSRGANGNFIIKNNDLGSKVNMNMVIPQMPSGGMQMMTLMKTSQPDIIYTINESNKTYSETEKSKAENIEDKEDYQVKVVGDEKVNGYNCVHAIVTHGKEKEDVWNTKDIVEFTKYNDAFNSNNKISSSKRQQALKNAGCDGFLVKMVRKGNAQEGDFTFELVGLLKKDFLKSEFEIPTGYKKVETGSAAGMPAGIKTPEEIMKMSPEERDKYIKEMQEKYGK